jgi:hypothetical protein
LDFINEKKDKRLEGSIKVRKRSTQGDIISKSYNSLALSLTGLLNLTLATKNKKKLKNHFNLAYFISFAKRPIKKKAKK